MMESGYLAKLSALRIEKIATTMTTEVLRSA